MTHKLSSYRRPKLVNAEAMAQQHPATFSIPEGRNALGEGDLAKVSCGGERFWCSIHRVVEGIYYGEVNNHLVCTGQHGLILGDKIKFAPCNIHQSQRKSD